MKRRTLLGSAAMTLGGASVIGTGAFTSVRAERSISVDVVSDSKAFISLKPCDDDSKESESSDQTGDGGSGSNSIPQASDFVYQTNDGTIAIDLTAVDDEGDKREGVSGEGITTDSLWRFPNAFRITNRGTQDVAVDLKLEDSEGEIPTVASKGEINGHSLDEDAPAVIFYKGSDSSEQFSSDELNPDTDGAVHLEPGDPVCVGFNVRTLGLEGGDLQDLTLRIRAEARDESDAPIGDGSRSNLVFGKQNGDSQRIRKLAINRTEISNPIGNNAKIDALGPLAYTSDDGSAAPFLKNENKIETTGGEKFDLDSKANDESTLLAVGSFKGSSVSIFYAGESGGIHRVSGDEAVNIKHSDAVRAQAIAGIEDINNDGKNELVFVNEDSKVEYLTAENETKVTDIDIGSTNSIGQPAKIGDKIKIPIVNDNGDIKLIRFDGNNGFVAENVAENKAYKAAQAPLTAIDIDGDENPEIVYISEPEDSSGNSGGEPKLKFIDGLPEDPSVKKITIEGDEISASSNVGIA